MAPDEVPLTGLTISINCTARKVVVLLDDEEASAGSRAMVGQAERDWLPESWPDYIADSNFVGTFGAAVMHDVRRSSKSMAILVDGKIVPFRNGDKARLPLEAGAHHMVASLTGKQGAKGAAVVSGPNGEAIKLDVEIFSNAGQGYSTGTFET